MGLAKRIELRKHCANVLHIALDHHIDIDMIDNIKVSTSSSLQPTARVNIDTGAYATGRLACLVLDDADKRFI